MCMVGIHCFYSAKVASLLNVYLLNSVCVCVYVLACQHERQRIPSISQFSPSVELELVHLQSEHGGRMRSNDTERL